VLKAVETLHRTNIFGFSRNNVEVSVSRREKEKMKTDNSVRRSGKEILEEY
jgi:hypothetical protein